MDNKESVIKPNFKGYDLFGTPTLEEVSTDDLSNGQGVLKMLKNQQTISSNEIETLKVVVSNLSVENREQYGKIIRYEEILKANNRLSVICFIVTLIGDAMIGYVLNQFSDGVPISNDKSLIAIIGFILNLGSFCVSLFKKSK